MTKYKNRKVETVYGTFDSAKEYDRYRQLLLLARAGKIQDLQRQTKFTLIPKQTGPDGKVLERACEYVADFTYQENGQTVVEDVKGYRDPSSAGYAKFVIKRKLMLLMYGIRIREI